MSQKSQFCPYEDLPTELNPQLAFEKIAPFIDHPDFGRVYAPANSWKKPIWKG